MFSNILININKYRFNRKKYYTWKNVSIVLTSEEISHSDEVVRIKD